MGSVLRVVLGLRVGALVARRALDHGRQAGGRTLDPAFFAGHLSPVVDPLHAAGAVGLPGRTGGVVGRALPLAGLVELLGRAGAYRGVALTEAVGVARVGVAGQCLLGGEEARLAAVFVGGDGDEVEPLRGSFRPPATAFATGEAEPGGDRLEAGDIGVDDLAPGIARVVLAVVAQGVLAHGLARGAIDVAVVLHHPDHVVGGIGPARVPGRAHGAIGQDRRRLLSRFVVTLVGRRSRVAAAG